MDEMSYEEVLQQVGCLLTRNIGRSMLPLLRQNQDSIMIERCDPYHLAKYDVIMFRPSLLILLCSLSDHNSIITRQGDT